jgi:hypothetical protein
MRSYKVIYRNYGQKKGELLGTLVERRKDLRGMTEVASGLKWAKVAFGHLVEDDHAIFIVPCEFDLGTDRIVLGESGLYELE